MCDARPTSSHPLTPISTAGAAQQSVHPMGGVVGQWRDPHNGRVGRKGPAQNHDEDPRVGHARRVDPQHIAERAHIIRQHERHGVRSEHERKDRDDFDNAQRKGSDNLVPVIRPVDRFQPTPPGRGQTPDHHRGDYTCRDQRRRRQDHAEHTAGGGIDTSGHLVEPVAKVQHMVNPQRHAATNPVPHRGQPRLNHIIGAGTVRVCGILSCAAHQFIASRPRIWASVMRASMSSTSSGVRQSGRATVASARVLVGRNCAVAATSPKTNPAKKPIRIMNNRAMFTT